MLNCELSLDFNYCRPVRRSAERSTDIDLTPEQVERYGRQLTLPGMSEEAQARLLAARVLVLGLGGSGTAAALLLAQAGVGHIRLMDPAAVSREDVQFQALYTRADVGRARGQAAKLRLARLSTGSKFDYVEGKLSAHTAEDIIDPNDVVVDSLDDWQDKLLASDACMKTWRPLVHAGVTAFNFQIFTMVPGKSACLRCVFSQVGLEDVPTSKTESGRFEPVCTMAGSFQALETIKLIARLGASAADEIVTFDGLRRTLQSTHGLTPRVDCPDCGRRLQGER